MKDGAKPYMAEQISGEWIVTRTFAYCGRGEGSEADARAIADAMSKSAAKPTTFLAERAQLEQEWCELRHLKAQYKQHPPAAARSDAEIVAQTEEVAALLALTYDGSTIADGVLYRKSTHPLAIRCWDTACKIQEILTATDVENALAELDEEKP